MHTVSHNNARSGHHDTATLTILAYSQVVYMPRNSLGSLLDTCHWAGPYLEKMIGGGGGGGGANAWPKATARGRVQEGDVPPPVRIAKPKLPPYKVNGHCNTI